MSLGGIPKIAGVVALVLIGLMALFGSWYTVNQTERGVLLINGAASPVAADPGLHLKYPIIESVVEIETTQRTVRWDQSSGQDFRQEAYSQDQQVAKLGISVIWHVPPGSVVSLYEQYKTVEAIESNLINRRVPQDVKTVFGQFTAVSAIQNRAQMNAQIFQAVITDSEIAKAPIVIDGVQVEDIEFSPEYVKSVEAAMQARVEVQKLEQQKKQQEVTAEITVINAEAEAKARVATATAAAEAARLQGVAEASAVRAKGDALRDNPQLVDLIRAERWNGVLPTTVLPSGTVPFLNAAPK